MISDEEAWCADLRFKSTATRCNFPVGKDMATAVPCRLSPAHGGDHLPNGAGQTAVKWDATEERVSEIAHRIAREGDIQVRKDYDDLVDQVKLLRSALTARLDAAEAKLREQEIALQLLDQSTRALMHGGPGTQP